MFTPVKRRRYRIKTGDRKVSIKVFLYIFIILVTCLSIIFFISNKRFWNGNDQLTLVVREKEGGVSILIFDPLSDEIVRVPIPQNTEIEVARELGIWKIGSLWDLGKQEGVAGEILTKSITRYFNIPCYIWSDSNALGFYYGGLKSLFSAMFLPYKSNLNFSDKIAIGIFSFTITNKDKYSLDLFDNGYLAKTVLSDGQEGFKLKNKDLPSGIAVLFSDPNFSQKEFRVSLIKRGRTSDQ